MSLSLTTASSLNISTTVSDSTGNDLLENQILLGNEHLNDIVKLQEHVNDVVAEQAQALLAAVSLCRVFCRMIADERFTISSHDSEASIRIVQWLRQRRSDYIESIAAWIGSADAKEENTAVTLLMRIVKH